MSRDSKRWLTEADEPYIAVPSPPPPRDRWLSKEEYLRLLAACDSDHMRMYVILGLSTAGRQEALLTLPWSSVDLSTGVVNLGRGRGCKRRAVVPVPAEALEALREARKRAETPYVIEWQGKPIKAVRTGWAAACRRAGIEDATPHVLRHTAATWLAMAGVPMAEIAKFLGDSVKVTERVYAKHHPDYLRSASAALAMPLGRPAG